MNWNKTAAKMEILAGAAFIVTGLLGKELLFRILGAALLILGLVLLNIVKGKDPEQPEQPQDPMKE